MTIARCLFLWLLIFTSCKKEHSIEADKLEITRILEKQQNDWSNNNLIGFMDGYHQSDSLFFFSGSKLKTGWKTTLDSYQKNYPDTSHTGKLTFNIVKIYPIDNDAYFVMGEYLLERTIGNAKGSFMIIFKRINGEWKIIADSSC
ncbi:YybH family protein [Maribacter sp. LLG6340-A2]|uniref:YybH family protein n=1 Tax=Maribacter sp. LLG6340-A2 TaxID=3160834 RepID=UPI00386FF2A6